MGSRVRLPWAHSLIPAPFPTVQCLAMPVLHLDLGVERGKDNLVVWSAGLPVDGPKLKKFTCFGASTIYRLEMNNFPKVFMHSLELPKLQAIDQKP